MAILHDCSNRWLLKKTFKPSLEPIKYFALLILFFVFSFLYIKAFEVYYLAAPVLIVCYIFYKKILQIFEFAGNKGWSFFFGYRGERWAMKELMKLSNYHVFYDVKFEDEKGNIDFIVVCEHGIFTIEVKNHSRARAESESWNKSEKRQALSESQKVKDHLEKNFIPTHTIIPIVVRADKRALPYKVDTEVEKIGTLGHKQLVDYFENYVPKKYGTLLSEDEQRKIVHTIEKIAGCKTHPKQYT